MKIIGFGKGSKTLEPHLVTLDLTNIEIGKYHNIDTTTGPWHIIPQQSTFIWEDYPMGDPYNPDDYATAVGEPVEQSRAEVVAILTNYDNLATGGDVSFERYRDRDKKLLATSGMTIPEPLPGEYWIWYSVVAWLGKFPHEINEGGLYFTLTTSPWHS